MIAPDEAQQLIMAIYDAAVDEGAWSRLPAVISQGLGANSAALWLADESGFRGVMHNHEEKYLRAYVDYYRFRDPWVLPIVKNCLFSRVLSSPEIIPDRDLRKTEFFSDFMLPTKTGPVLGGVLQVGDRICTIGVHRAPGEKDFTTEQKERLQSWLPHLKHAVHLKYKIAAHQRAGEHSLEVVDGLSAPFILCNRQGRVVFANKAAERLQASSKDIFLGTSSQPICLRRREPTRQLHALIEDAASGGPGGGLRLIAGPEINMFITVTPVPRSIGGAGGAMALIAVRADTGDNLPSIELLRGLFRLTVAEAQIALELLANRSLSEIRFARGVTENTIRTQLAHILAKTGAANQRELVRLLSTIPIV